MRPVIYQIVIKGGSRTYIGSARHLPNRKKAHLHLLRNGKHHSRALQRAVDKYGLDSISWTILEDVDDESRLIEREQVWLDKFSGKLYNRSPTASSRLGCKASDEVRAQLSARLRGNQYRKGIPHSPEIREKISLGIKRANAEGRRRIPKPNPAPVIEYNRKVVAGEIIHYRSKPTRDALILAAFNEGRLMEEIGAEHGITKGAVSCVVRRLLNPPKGKWSKRCQGQLL